MPILHWVNDDEDRCAAHDVPYRLLEEELAHWPYTGRYQFAKHYYSMIGELEAGGEDFECAQAVDGCYQVKHWVRNLAQQPNFSFRLPLTNGYFHPDFICELKDSRILVVELKVPTWKNTRRKSATSASCGQKRARIKPCSCGR